MPGLGRLILSIERANAALGRAAAWLILAMTLVQFGLVLMRYVYGTGATYLGESVFYMYGLSFLLAAGYTMGADRHVRVDVFYRDMGPKRRAIVDLAGVVLFVAPMCWLLGREAVPYALRSWAELEGARSAGGIPAVFVLKTAIPVFVLAIAAQGLAWAGRCVLTLTGRPVPPPVDGTPEASEEPL